MESNYSKQEQKLVQRMIAGTLVSCVVGTPLGILGSHFFSEKDINTKEETCNQVIEKEAIDEQIEETVEQALVCAKLEIKDKMKGYIAQIMDINQTKSVEELDGQMKTILTGSLWKEVKEARKVLEEQKNNQQNNVASADSNQYFATITREELASLALADKDYTTILLLEQIKTNLDLSVIKTQQAKEQLTQKLEEATRELEAYKEQAFGELITAYTIELTKSMLEGKKGVAKEYADLIDSVFESTKEMNGANENPYTRVVQIVNSSFGTNMQESTTKETLRREILKHLTKMLAINRASTFRMMTTLLDNSEAKGGARELMEIQNVEDRKITRLNYNLIDDGRGFGGRKLSFNPSNSFLNSFNQTHSQEFPTSVDSTNADLARGKYCDPAVQKSSGSRKIIYPIRSCHKKVNFRLKEAYRKLSKDGKKYEVCTIIVPDKKESGEIVFRLKKECNQISKAWTKEALQYKALSAFSHNQTRKFFQSLINKNTSYDSKIDESGIKDFSGIDWLREEKFGNDFTKKTIKEYNNNQKQEGKIPFKTETSVSKCFNGCSIENFDPLATELIKATGVGQPLLIDVNKYLNSQGLSTVDFTDYSYLEELQKAFYPYYSTINKYVIVPTARTLDVIYTTTLETTEVVLAIVGEHVVAPILLELITPMIMESALLSSGGFIVDDIARGASAAKLLSKADDALLLTKSSKLVRPVKTLPRGVKSVPVTDLGADDLAKLKRYTTKNKFGVTNIKQTNLIPIDVDDLATFTTQKGRVKLARVDKKIKLLDLDTKKITDTNLVDDLKLKPETIEEDLQELFNREVKLSKKYGVKTTKSYSAKELAKLRNKNNPCAKIVSYNETTNLVAFAWDYVLPSAEARNLKPCQEIIDEVDEAGYKLNKDNRVVPQEADYSEVKRLANRRKPSNWEYAGEKYTSETYRLQSKVKNYSDYQKKVKLGSSSSDAKKDLNLGSDWLTEKQRNIYTTFKRENPNGVQISNQGFAEFDPNADYVHMVVDRNKVFGGREAGGDEIQKVESWYLKTYNKPIPKNHTVHHSHDRKTFFIMKSEIHKAVSHTGGSALTNNLPNSVNQGGVILKQVPKGEYNHPNRIIVNPRRSNSGANTTPTNPRSGRNGSNVRLN